jgi:hypothetical protein
MDAVELKVKTFIEKLSTGGDPTFLNDDTVLSDLDFDDNACKALVNKLNTYVKTINPAASISRDDVTPDSTAGEVVELVKEAIK